MRNLTPILLALVVLSSGCDPEDTSGYNCTSEGCFADPANAQYLTLEDCLSACDEENNTNPSVGSWSFEITLNGNTYAAAGENSVSTILYGATGTGGYAGLINGNLSIRLSLLDITAEDYISGGYISMTLGCENPFVGINEFTISGTDDLIDYLPNSAVANSYTTYKTAWMLDNTTTMTELGYYIPNQSGIWVGNGYYYNPKLPFNITSLGTSSELAAGENLEGDYSGTLYFLDLSTLSENPTLAEIQEIENMPFTVPLEIEVSFSVPRTS